MDEKVDAAVSEPKHIAVDGNLPAVQATTWDPYEIWLTRVKQPRDRAGASQMAGPVRRGDSVS